MSLIQDLENLPKIGKYEHDQITAELRDHPALVRKLANCDSIRRLLRLIETERTTRQRKSTLNRLYGRYNKLVSARDYEQLMGDPAWEKENEK